MLHSAREQVKVAVVIVRQAGESGADLLLKSGASLCSVEVEQVAIPVASNISHFIRVAVASGDSGHKLLKVLFRVLCDADFSQIAGQIALG